MNCNTNTVPYQIGFQGWNNTFMTFFVTQDVVHSSKLRGVFKMWGKNMVGYRVDESNQKCVNHAIDEISFINYIRNKQTRH